MERVTRMGLFGPWDAPDLISTPRTPASTPGLDPSGLDSFQLWPNFVILVGYRTGIHLPLLAGGAQ